MAMAPSLEQFGRYAPSSWSLARTGAAPCSEERLLSSASARLRGTAHGRTCRSASGRVHSSGDERGGPMKSWHRLTLKFSLVENRGTHRSQLPSARRQEFLRSRYLATADRGRPHPLPTPPAR